MKLLYAIICSAIIAQSLQATIVDALYQASAWIYVRLGIISQKEVNEQINSTQIKIKAKLKTLRSNQKALEESFKEQSLGNAISREEEYRALKIALNRNTGAIEELEESLDSLRKIKQSNKQNIEAEVNKLCEVNRTLARIEEKNKYLSSTLKSHSSRFKDLNEDLKKLDHRLENIENNIENLDTQANSLENKLKEAEDRSQRLEDLIKQFILKRSDDIYLEKDLSSDQTENTYNSASSESYSQKKEQYDFYEKQYDFDE